MNPMSPVRDNRFYYVCMLRSKKNELWYTGLTVDLRKRFKEHDASTIDWTKNKGSFELIYCEASKNIADARSREKYLKSDMGKRYLKNRLKRSLSLTG